jgi:phosphoribosylglycinamide formyltransferase 1
MTLRLGVLASGEGTNLEAILAAIATGDLDAEVAVVICNVPDAKVLHRAEAAGVPTVCLDHRAYESREAFDADMVEALIAHRVAWVALAGFMRLVTPKMIEALDGRILNIHPSLLPAFPGLRAPAQAVARGVKVSGCTVHLVDTGTDTGPILAQAVVPVHPDDDDASLGRRIQAQEHRLYPRVLQWIAEGRLVRSDGRAHLRDLPAAGDALTVPALVAAGPQAASTPPEEPR